MISIFLKKKEKENARVLKKKKKVTELKYQNNMD